MVPVESAASNNVGICIENGLKVAAIRHFNLSLLLISVLVLVVGCASLEPVRTERYLWPQPPEKPRIEWLGSYRSQLDLKMTTGRRIKEMLVGEDAPVMLKRPVEVRADARHNKAYIADLQAAAVYVFDFNEPELRFLSFDGAGLSGSVKPISLALDSNDNLYVLEPNYHKILVFNSSEQFVKAIDIKAVKRPLSMAVDKAQARLYVADAELSRVSVLDLDGRFLFSFGGPGNEAGQFNRPVGMSVNSKGELHVAEAFNARIQIFDRQGNFLRVFGSRGTGDADFQLIKGVAVDSDNNVYVIDGRSNNIKVFNQSGEFLLALGDYYMISDSGKVVPGGFALPVGIDIDGSNRMYVVDQLNARLQIFQYLPESDVDITGNSGGKAK